MHLNFILSLFVNSLFFQMITPASFVPTEIFPRMARTIHNVILYLPCSQIYVLLVEKQYYWLLVQYSNSNNILL
jgi:hypothetical protein